MTQAPINWPKLAPAIATALLGKPVRQTRREMRYGRKGSFRINLETGTFADFESGQSGGMLDLIQHRKGGDAQTAWRWLQDHGLVAAPVGRAAPAPRQSAPVAPREAVAPPRTQTDDDTAALDRAGDLWRRAIEGTGTPVPAYLMGRGCWRPEEPLPADVRWIDAAAIRTLHWDPPVPAAAIGGMIVAFTGADGALKAVQIEALRPDGRRPRDRWRKARGRMAGAAFRIAGAGPLRLCEGPIDALALAAAYRGPVWAAGGSGNLQRLAGQAAALGRPVIVHADGDAAGAGVAAAFANALRRGGGACRIVRQDGMDPADWVAERVRERAAILEFDAGLEREDADRQAWERTQWI